MLKRNPSSSDVTALVTPEEIASALQRVKSSSSLSYYGDSLSPIASSFSTAPALSALQNSQNVTEIKQRLTEALDFIEKLRADIRTERLARQSLKRSHESKMSGLFEKVKMIDTSSASTDEIAKNVAQINRMRAQISRLEEENRSLHDQLHRYGVMSESSLMELDDRINEIERRTAEDANKRIKEATAAANASLESERQRLLTLAQYAKDNEELLLARLESEHLQSLQFKDLLESTAKDLELARRHNEQLTSEYSSLVRKSESLETSIYQLDHLVRTEREVNKNVSRISKIDSLRRAEDKLRRVIIIKRDRACLHRYFTSWRVQAARFTIAQASFEKIVLAKNAASNAMLQVADSANAEKTVLFSKIDKLSAEKAELEAKLVQELNEAKDDLDAKLKAEIARSEDALKASAKDFRERLAYAKDEAEIALRQVRAEGKAEVERVKASLEALVVEALNERDEALKAEDKRYRDLGLQSQKDKEVASIAMSATLARMKRDSDEQKAIFEEKERERKRAVMRKVICRATNRRLSSGFTTWYKVAAEEKRLEQLLNRALRRMTHQRASRAFTRWTSFASESIRMKTLLRKIIGRALNSRVSAAFSSWSTNVAAGKYANDVQRLRAEIDAREKERKHAVMRKVICRATNRRLSSGFTTWYKVAAEEKRREQLLNRALRRMTHQRASQAFTRWTSFASESIRMKSLLRKIIGRALNSRVSAAFSSWSTNVAAGKYANDVQRLRAEIDAREKERKRAVMRKVICRATNRCLSSGFTTWYKVAAEEKRREQLLNRALRRMTHQRASRAFARWTSFASESIRMKTLLRKIIGQALNSRVSAAFSSWSTNVAAGKYANDVQRLRAEIDAREKERKRAVMRKVICRATNRCLSSGFTTWYKVAAEEKRLEQLLNRALRRMIYLRLSRAFSRWTDHSKESLRLKSLLSRSAATFKLSRAKVALREWRLRVIESKEVKAKREQSERIMRKALLRMQQIRLAGVFSRWQSNVFNIRRQRNLCRRVILRALNSRLSAGFSGWRFQTAILVAESIKRANDLERAELIEAHQLELKLLRAEIDARETARKRALMHKTICRALNSKLASGFTTWYKVAAEEKRREQLLNRALRRMIYLRLSRAFSRWTDHSKESLRLKSLLSRSAATFKLSRAKVALREWRLRVIESKEVKAKREQSERIMRKALLRMQQIRLAGVFSRWQSNVFNIRRQRNLCRRVILRALNSRLSAGFSGWRFQTAILVAESIKRANDLERAELIEAHQLELKLLRAEIDARETARKRALMHKTICRALNSKLASGFTTWYKVAAEEKRREQLLNRALRRMTHQRASRAFARWTSFASESIRMKTLLRKIIGRALNTRLSAAFSSWCTNATAVKYANDVQRLRAEIDARETARKRALMHKIICRALNSKLASGFTTWYKVAAEEKRREQLLNRALRRMTHQRASRAFARWTSFASESIRMKTLLRKIIGRALNTRLSAAFSSWCTNATAVKYANDVQRLRAEIDARETARKRALMHKTICRALNSKLASGFTTWYKVATEEKRREQLLNRAVRRMMNARLASGFSAWRIAAAEEKRLEQLLQRAVRRMSHLRLSRAFATWTEFRSVSKSARSSAARATEFQSQQAELHEQKGRLLTDLEQERKEHEAVLLLFREKERILRDTFAERERVLRESLSNLESQLATERQLRTLSEDYARREADRFSEEMRQVAFREPISKTPHSKTLLSPETNSYPYSQSSPLSSPRRILLSPRGKGVRVGDGLDGGSDAVRKIYMQ
jgi:hypothetical protein